MLTSWLTPPHATSGEDHQATRAVCEHLYARLLPGITNVTDRARYYSFYPWLIWKCHQEQIPAEDLLPTLRLADCLFTLIGLAGNRSNRALVGSGTLRSALESLPLTLSSFTHLKPAENRYFKNPRGGLGQYYLGSLELLGILHRQGNVIQVTPERGVPLAEAVDRGVDGDAFFRALRADRVDADTLAALHAFRPDTLPDCPDEHALLTSLMFNTPGPLHAAEVGASRRRLTLRLLLHLAHALGALPGQDDFRAVVYTGARPDGTTIPLPEELEQHRQRWAIYQRNDLLSLAAQGMFQAGLSRLDGVGGGRTANAAAFGTFVRDQLFDDLPDGTVAEALIRQELPDRSRWSSADHEIQLGRTILACNSRPDAAKQRTQARSALSLVLALCARDDQTRPAYGDEILTDRYLLPYPINLISLRAMQAEWGGMPLKALPGWIAGQWGVQAHLRVALRKLRQQSTDTFQIRPQQGALQVLSIPPAVESVPRYRTARQILIDLGMLAPNADGALVLTSRGKAQKEQDDG